MSQYSEEQYGQYANPEQQGFYQSGFTLDDQPVPGQQQQWSQGPTSYYSAPPPHQSHAYSSSEGYAQQSKRLTVKLKVRAWRSNRPTCSKVYCLPYASKESSVDSLKYVYIIRSVETSKDFTIDKS